MAGKKAVKSKEVKPGKKEPKFGVHSEVGQLRKVMVCAPGVAHSRLTPSNCDQLLFDDVLWVENAKRDHFDFVTKMRDRGIEVVEMHNLLAETVAVPAGKKWILDNQVVPDQVGLGLHRRAAQLSRGPRQPQARRNADRRAVDARLSGKARRRGAQGRQGSRRRHRVPAAAVAEHALHARHHLLDLRRRHAQSAVLARAARRNDPHDRDLQVPSGLRRQGQRVVGRPDQGPRPGDARRRRRDAHRQGQRADRHERAHVAPGDQPARGDAVQEGRRRARDRRGDAQDPRGDAPRHGVHVRRPRLRAARARLPGQDHDVLVPPEQPLRAASSCTTKRSPSSTSWPRRWA